MNNQPATTTIGAPLVLQRVRWGERYVSSSLNKKFSGVVPPGIYRGFTLSPGGIMKVFVGNDSDFPRSIAIVERDGYNLTITMEAPGFVDIPTVGEWFIVVEAFYTETQQGYQHIVARQHVDPHHVVIGKVIVNSLEDAAKPLTAESINTDLRHQNNPLGTLNPKARRELEQTWENQAAIAANMIRLSNRLARVELDHAANGSTGEGGGMSPSGTPLPGGGSVAPITILPEGAEPVEGAALTFVVSDFTAPSGE